MFFFHSKDVYFLHKLLLVALHDISKPFIEKLVKTNKSMEFDKNVHKCS